MANDNKDSMNGLPLIPPEDDELFCRSESEDSSSSNGHIFENQPVVMELHGVQRDELPDNPLPEVKTRKLLKKKRPKPDQDLNAGSLTSSSAGSVVPPGTEKQEEFYDAHESYYEFPENQSSAAALSSLAIMTSQHENNPEALSPEVKQLPETTAVSGATTTAATQDTATSQTPITSAVTKPIHPTPK